MNIGDLFLRARLESQSLITDAKKAGTKAGTAAGTRMSASMSKSLKQGVALGAGIAGFNLLGGAIQGVTRYLGDAADAFREDELSITKLRTALRANIADWDGNTDAIEKRIEAGQALGFSDEAQRSSIAELAAAYGSEAKALEALAIAQDLARFSGVDLATASDTLIKVHAGNFRALKALGINTKDITTEQEAFAAILKVVSGQAEAYADTLTGKLAVAEERAGEASEKFGESIARIQAIAIPLATDAIVSLADSLDGLQTAMDETAPPTDRVRGAIDLLSEGLLGAFPLGQVFRDLAEDMGDGSTQADMLAGKFGDLDRSTDDLADTFDSSVDDARRFAAKLNAIEQAADDAEQAIDDLSDTISTELFGDAINAGRIAELNETYDELIKQRDAAKEGTREYRILTGEIAENRQALFDLQLEMKQEEGPDAVIAWLKEQIRRYGDANGALAKMIQNYQILAAAQRAVKPIPVYAPSGSRYAGKALPTFAAGGRYRAGEPRIVGEHGPELDIPDRSGYIVPNPMASTASLTAAPTASVSSSSTLAINGGIHVDARGLPNPGAVGAAVRQGIADAMADVLQSQSARLPVGTRA